jgi:hypothetical protein
MQVLDYSCRVFLAALSSSVARANFIISVIIVIAGAAIWFAPNLGMTIDASELMTTLRSPAFLTALVGAVISFRLVCAQYWLWTEEHDARIKAESQTRNYLRESHRRQILLTMLYPSSSRETTCMR